MTAPITAPGVCIDLTRDFHAMTALARQKILMQTQIINTGGADNPPYSESHHYRRTSKRISAYG